MSPREYIEIELHREIPILLKTTIIKFSFFMLKARTLDSMQSFAIVLSLPFWQWGAHSGASDEYSYLILSSLTDETSSLERVSETLL